MVPVRVQGVVLDPITRGFAVILKDDINDKWLPIYIGQAEATSIALEMEKTKLPRPGTHDLIKLILDNLNANVIKININEVQENTYYASITVEANGIQKDIDSRPSDAIAIALRSKAPILVSESVLAKAGMEAHPHHNMDEKTKKLNGLQVKLTDAIEKENYEEAASLRDEISKINPEAGRKQKTDERPKTND